MTSGREQRTHIDTETVKALLLINGGGAIALLTLLPSFLGKGEYDRLAHAILVGVIVLMFGLVFAVIHNHFRRRCSLHYELHNMRPPKGRLLGMELWEPTVCAVSTTCMCLSIAAFLIAGSYVAIAGLCTLGN